MSALVENIRVALAALSANKLRAILTMLGISIGVAAVIVLVSLGQAVQDYVAQQFLGIGTNLAFVFPASFTSNTGGTGVQASNRFSVAFSTLTERDVTALQDPFNVPDARAVVPLLRMTRSVTYGGSQARTRISATMPQYFPVRNRSIALGRTFDDQEATSDTRVAVIGQTVLKNLFPPDMLPLDETIRINGVPFRVIGILAKYGGASFQDEDDVIVIPLMTGQTRLQSARSLTGSKPVTVIYMEAVSDKAMESMVSQTAETLRRLHNINYRDADDFQVLTQKDLLESFGQITSLLTIFLGVIAGISLIVGGIGIMNIMLVTVTERTREIGLRKAVGAREWDVLLQFLVEATTLAFAGGLAGLAIATLGTVGLRLALPALNAFVRPESVLLATSISAGIGIFFGLYPASRASRLSPIDALRYE
jgi:putative ABC transport system permease protein